ncbi:MAG: hypothetical protein E5W81_27330 [Mesorhizobium sp.]|nr:MAG: hypothetical protein E5V36_04490 [Mesorhizobium sp.]TKB38975.1 MAG: hypothetical protein E5W81_27330 [Mesorhizobium sp.]
MENRTWVEIVQANVQRFGNLVVGIDPSLPDVPHAFVRDGGANWFANYVDFILDTVEGRVGFVKFQSAYFEARGLIGLNALSVAMHRAKAAGMGVILDAKRRDIGATATAYAQAYLAPASAGGSGDFEADSPRTIRSAQVQGAAQLRSPVILASAHVAAAIAVMVEVQFTDIAAKRS